MALTQADWYQKIRGFVPAWWFESEHYQDALLQAIAAVFAELDTEADNHFNETFLTKSDAPILDAHGDERNVTRLTGELGSPYAQRIRYIINQSNPNSIATLVNALLVKGTCIIREHATDRIFLGQSFLNRREVFTDESYDVFSIVVDKQVHDPYSFLSRGNFASRSDFFGTNASDLGMFQALVAAVNKAKAFGVLYRVTETNE